MARKSKVLLNAPVELPKLSRQFLGTTLNMPIPPGVEEEFKHYYDACVELEEQYVRVDQLCEHVDAQGSSHPDWPSYLLALRKLTTLQSKAFGTCDRLRFAIQHLDDPVLVPDEDMRMIIKDSLSDKLEELQFNVNVGLLGSKIALALRNNTQEGSAGDPPFCQDCDGT